MGERTYHAPGCVGAPFCSCAEAEIDNLRSTVAALEAKLAEQSAILEWIGAALSGEPVSDFAESFPLVAEAALLRTESQRWQEAAAAAAREMVRVREALRLTEAARQGERDRSDRAEAALADVIRLAEAAMHDANKDGYGYDIEAELAPARAVLVPAPERKDEVNPK